MAIDKNSKAYNSLLNKGYTDEQITQMYDTASKQGTTKWVVPTTYDPMADLTPEYIANMDMNKQIRGANQSFSQYWDDSSRDKQDTRWWLNQKYTWEWVNTSDINYNPDITTKDLNPNFVYGKQSQVYGTDHPWYISQRNDDIASALYNEWLVSREDVTRFLMAQNWFTNSSEEDRLNTIESVWKRLWAIAEQNREKPDPSKAEELLTDTSGKIYGKVTADEGNPKEWIDTLADDNSVFRAMEESRVANLKSLIANNPADIAEAILSWVSPYWEQTMRDARQLYPEFMAEVEAEKKKKLWQENVNAIASGWEIQTAADKVDTNTEATSYAVNNATSTTSATQLLKGIDAILESNDTAKSAQDLMGSIEKDMATLKNRLKNLRQEANAAFKWDVPDYLVNAYINNKSQEIQNQLSILEDRYNAAYNRYKTELGNTQWEMEYKLKEKQLALQEKELDLKKYQSDGTTTSSTWWLMRTERHNNPTAMTTDYAKMMWLELWVDYEIWDPFIWWDGKTYYTARFLWDPIETAIKAFDRWAANNVFANEWWVLWHRHLWISNQQWLNMTDWEKREVINKILQKEWGSMENMTYYRQNSGIGDDSNWARWDWTTFDLTKSSIYNSLSATDKEAVKQLLNLSLSRTAVFSRWAKYDNPSGIMSAVSQINPEWRETDINEATKVRTKWNSGWEWGWLDRAATAWDFAKQMYELMDEFTDEEWNATNEWLKKQWVTNIWKLNEIKVKALEQLWDTRITNLKILLDGLVNEYEWALKWGNAALAAEDVNRVNNLFSIWLSKNQLKTAMNAVGRAVFDKVATAAQQYRYTTMEKPQPVWIPSVTTWLYWLRPTMSDFFIYDWTPAGWNAPSSSWGNEDYLAQNWL